MVDRRHPIPQANCILEFQAGEDVTVEPTWDASQPDTTTSLRSLMPMPLLFAQPQPPVIVVAVLADNAEIAGDEA